MSIKYLGCNYIFYLLLYVSLFNSKGNIMKLLPVISRPLYKDDLERKHRAPKSLSATARGGVNIRYNARNNTNQPKSDIKIIKQLYRTILMLNSVLKKMHPSFSQTEVVKFSFNKWVRMAARERSRNRKQILQSQVNSVSEKQQNLDDLVADLEIEDMLNKPVSLSHHDIASWLCALKKHEFDQLRLAEQKEHGNNLMLADLYLENLRQKNVNDARFLREKTFAQKSKEERQEDIDLQELYDTTQNIRHVIYTFNKQRFK